MEKVGTESAVIKQYEVLSEDVDSLERQKSFYKRGIEEYKIAILSIDKRINSALIAQQGLQEQYYSDLMKRYNSQTLVSDLMSYGNVKGDKNCRVFASLIENRLKGDTTSTPINDKLVLWCLRQIEKSREENRIGNIIRIEHVLEIIGLMVPFQEKQDENLIKLKDRALLDNFLDNENSGLIAAEVTAERIEDLNKSKESMKSETSTQNEGNEESEAAG